MARRKQYKLSVGELVSRSLGIYFRNLLPFALLATVVMSPWAALLLWSAYGGAGSGQVVVWLVAIAQTVLGFMLTGAVSFGVVMQLRGEPQGLGACVNHGFRTFFAVLGTSLICGMRIMLWSLLLWVPGIIEQVRLYVAIPVAVLEGKTGNVAATRSSSLTHGSGWQIFGSWLLVFALGFGMQYLLQFVFLGDGFSAEWESNVDMFLWSHVAVVVLLQAFGATMMAVAYFLLRTGKENIGAREIARVFD